MPGSEARERARIFGQQEGTSWPLTADNAKIWSLPLSFSLLNSEFPSGPSQQCVVTVQQASAASLLKEATVYFVPTNGTSYFKHLCSQASWLRNSTSGGPGVAIRASCRFSHSEDMWFRSVRPNPTFNCRLTPPVQWVTTFSATDSPDRARTSLWCCDTAARAP